LEQGYRVETKIPTGFTSAYDSFLFNDKRHLQLQAETWLNFYLLRNADHKVIAHLPLFIQGQKAYTPFRAPFGSFSLVRQIIPLVLYQFIQECEKQLLKKKVTHLQLKEPPLFYRRNGELLHTILFNLGYSASLAEVSSGVTIDQIKFEEKIQERKQRKLRQMKIKGFLFKKMKIDELDTVYNFLLKCRTQRGQSLSMTLKELQATVAVFTDSFLLSGVYFQKELAAASISIKLNEDILYVFYAGHLEKFDPASPVILLFEGLYKFCRTKHLSLLDFGTSALKGQPNFNLLDFKLHMGATPSMKLTFEKELK
jgi:hypothetical protein